MHAPYLVADRRAAAAAAVAWIADDRHAGSADSVRQSAAGLGHPVLLPCPIEGDGVMAMLGWLFALFTVVWTAFLLMIGHAAILAAIAALQQILFD